MKNADVIIIGAGIVGLATAYRLTLRHPEKRILVLEKEKGPGCHQSGHNSGVLHSGVYYRPGSMKAKTCLDGRKAMEVFCEEQGIPFERCGKVIVATCEEERPALNRIYKRGQANGVACEIIDKEMLATLEPHAQGVAAIHVFDAGIVDYKMVCKKLVELLLTKGHAVQFEREVIGMSGTSIHTDAGEYQADYVVNCCGLHSDRLARLSGLDPEVQIVPFKGEYYLLKPEAKHFCRNLIYPVPDPAFPFLGVHFTRMIDGSVECGPNAVPAAGREAYDKGRKNWKDIGQMVRYRGFRRLALRHWKMGLGEIWRSYSKPAFVRALQRLVPEIRSEHLIPAPAGIRAQAVAPDGSLVDDFVLQQSGALVHVCNAPSPAATASFEIAERICDALPMN